MSLLAGAWLGGVRGLFEAAPATAAYCDPCAAGDHGDCDRAEGCPCCADIDAPWSVIVRIIDPLPRILDEYEAADPVYQSYLTGNPHPDPFLASKGWETHPSGVFSRGKRADQ